MADNTMALQADYADALLNARIAKNWLFLIILLTLLGQLTIFVLARSGKVALPPVAPPAPVSAVVPDNATLVFPGGEILTPAPTTAPVAGTGRTTYLLHYMVGLCGYVGFASALILDAVLLMIVLVMVVGRLVGVGRLTSAFLWCVVLTVFLFPWQAFLNNADLTGVDFKVPGVIYTWNELVHTANFPLRSIDGKLLLDQAILKWARYVAFPLVAVLMIITIQVKAVRGLKQTLGEDTQIAPLPNNNETASLK